MNRAGQGSVLRPRTGKSKNERARAKPSEAVEQKQSTKYSSRASTAGSRSEETRSCGYLGTWGFCTTDAKEGATVEATRHHRSTHGPPLVRVHAGSCTIFTCQFTCEDANQRECGRLLLSFQAFQGSWTFRPYTVHLVVFLQVLVNERMLGNTARYYQSLPNSLRQLQVQDTLLHGCFPFVITFITSLDGARATGRRSGDTDGPGDRTRVESFAHSLSWAHASL